MSPLLPLVLVACAPPDPAVRGLEPAAMETVQVMLSVSPPGAGAIEGGYIWCEDQGEWYTFPVGTELELRAIPFHDYRFEDWVGCEGAAGDVCTVTLWEDADIWADFDEMAPDATLVWEPASWEFADLVEGEISELATLALLNSGSEHLAVDEVWLDSDEEGGFRIAADACSGTELDAGEGCEVQVFHDGTVFGYQRTDLVAEPVHPRLTEATAELRITAISQEDCFEAPVAGLDISPWVADCGEAREWEESDPATFTVTSTGEIPLVIDSIHFAPADSTHTPQDFAKSRDDCTANLLSPGESCTFDVVMRPTGTGELAVLVAIESNAGATWAEAIGTSLPAEPQGEGLFGCASGGARGRSLPTLLALIALGLVGVRRRSPRG
jgi:hypothetical protein